MNKKRSPNFTEMELQTLLNEVEKQKSLLFSKHTNVATNAVKNRAWENIYTKINSCNKEYVRTTEEVRKKWTTYTSNTKKYAAQIRREARRTGGGPPIDELTPLQDKVVGIIGTTPIEGIEGGVDTCPMMECVSVTSQTRDLDSSNENGM